MPHFFITPDQIKEKEITVTGGDVRHIRDVLRMKVGDWLTFSDGAEALCYHAAIAEIGGAAVRCELLYAQATDHELPVRVCLFQGLAKGDKMETVIQKAVELGVHEIVPVATARSVVRLDAKRAAAKRQRWQAISEAAAKQSMRQVVPLVRDVTDFAEAVTIGATMDVALIPYELADDFEKTKKIIDSIKVGQSVAVFIGPEGGFTAAEIELAAGAGMKAVTMGRRILRTETAALVILSWLIYTS